MRTQHSRPAVAAGALLILGATAPAASAVADRPGGAAAKRPAIKITDTRLDVRAGRRVLVRGSVAPGPVGRVVRLQVFRGGKWRTVDRDGTNRRARYVLRERVERPGSLPVRLAFGDRTRRLRRLRAFRVANASWYGPGLYGNRTACGGRLHPGTRGVAHKWLPCGTRVTFRRGNRMATVRVIDRGPYVGGREYDLTQATAQRLGFRGHGGIDATR